VVLDPVLVAPLAAVYLATVPARCAPSDALGFHKNNIDAGLGKMKRRREPRVSAADNGDAAKDRSGQRRE